MEGIPAAAREFLAETAAVEAALEIDRRREAVLRELHDAFLAFRDADESIHRLVRRIQQPLWEVHEPPGARVPQNLWGFQNEDERLFAERFAAAAPRFPDLDLASLFRSYLHDEARSSDEKKVQLLLAFGEFVASVDAKAGEGEPRLGVGPAANFLTFAWHCLSMGVEPVFLFTANRVAKALDEAMGTSDAPGAHLERRFTTFFALASKLGDALSGAPAPMRRGWAIEHALEFIVERYERTGQIKALLQDPGASGTFKARPDGEAPLRPVIVAPSGGAPAATTTTTSATGAGGSVRIERPKIVVASGSATATVGAATVGAVDAPPDPEPAVARIEAAPTIDVGPAPATDPRRPAPADDDTRARQRARIGELTKKRVVYGDPPPLVDRPGADLNEVLPPDRTPPVGMPRPESAPEAPAAPRPPEPPAAEATAPEPPALESKVVEPPAPEPKVVEPPAPTPEAAPAGDTKVGARADDAEPARQVEPWWATPVTVIPAKKAANTLKSAPAVPAPVEPVVQSERSAPTGTATAPAPPRSPAPPATPTSPTSPTDDLTEELDGPAVVGAGGPELDDESSDVAVDALLGELRGEVVQASRGEPSRATPPDRLAHDLFLDPGLLAQLQAALELRGRALLVGPPWSGKTHVARRMAIHLAGHIDRVLFVRLHPELSYTVLMGREPGLVRAFCERARDDRDQRYVLVLDELDRGDAARALGELAGALSESGQDVQLASTGAAFHVPRNLYVVATARSVPTDPALVGRFPVVVLPADPEVLRRYLAQCRPAMEWAADLLRTLNERLASEGAALRVGHGAFMDPDLDADRLRLIFRHEVEPLLLAHDVDREAIQLEALRREA